MHYQLLRRAGAPLALTLLTACAGNGQGLNTSGEPSTPGSAPAAPLTADFQSIQDNIFTPICTRCHSGAAAPEGLELDAAHSYALLVGVPSGEVPSIDRVNPGNPDSSYIVLKLENAPGIVGAQMPDGGPYLPQSTIDVIRQWITNGAQQGAPTAAAASAAFALTATAPADQALLPAPPRSLLVAFNREVDFSLVNDTTVSVGRVTPEGELPERVLLSQAPGNPATVLVRPAAELAPGTYRLHVRGTGPAALADLNAQALQADYVAEFTVGAAR
jgi:hypothetical protein